jgi:hypothetical protein
MGRFNRRVLAAELDMISTEELKANFMLLDDKSQADLLYAKLQQTARVVSVSQYDLLQDCLQATTDVNKRLDAENTQLRTLLEAATARNVELTERMCSLAERMAHVGLAQLESDAAVRTNGVRKKRCRLEPAAIESNVFAEKE